MRFLSDNGWTLTVKKNKERKIIITLGKTKITFLVSEREL